MVVQLKKGRDGLPTLVCVRADGTRTWRKVHPFFPIHDLTHYAVESILGFGAAFFGLVASGWSLDAFTNGGASARLPAEALWAEHIVGLFDLERGMQRPLGTEEFGEALATSLAHQGVPPFRPLSPGELTAVRALRSDLLARWLALAPGETLALSFPADALEPAPSERHLSRSPLVPNSPSTHGAVP